MTITQKKASNTATFVFHDDELQYTIKEPAGTASFRLTYEDFPEESSELEERRVWFRNAGVLWIIIGAVQLYLQFSKHGQPGFPFWLLLGIGCIGYYRLSATKFTVFDTARGRLYVIADKHHDRVLAEVRSRQAGQLKRRYAKILNADDPERETARLNWLLQRQVISQDEFESLMVDLRLGIADKLV